MPTYCVEPRCRRKLEKQATPEWADIKLIRAIYAECKRRRKNGEDVVVDHVVPIDSAQVCGLHVHYNLQIIDRELNIHKSNHYWPDMPCENLDLFTDIVEYQIRSNLGF